ncbi:MAG: hypothetical protein AAF636_11770 [Pseudomonadota bacterium]
MGKRPDPLFLERSRYRARRWLDAIRLIVFIGTALWMIPLLWPVADPPETQGVPTSAALAYVFGVWVCLIALSAVLTFRARISHDQTKVADP